MFLQGNIGVVINFAGMLLVARMSLVTAHVATWDVKKLWYSGGNIEMKIQSDLRDDKVWRSYPKLEN